VSKRPTCPVCGGIQLTPWSLGKTRCTSCARVFSSWEIESKEYTPKVSRSRSTRAQADKQEKRVAKELDARQTIASGQTPIDKGDIRSDVVRVECKYTDAKSYTLKADDLTKIASQATGEQIPLFYVEFRKAGDAYYVVPEHWFLALLEAYNDQNGK
jgi:uncharacterized Zn finger protein (UPF0148 family)